MNILLLGAEMNLADPTVLAGAVVLALQGAVAYFFKSMAGDFKEMTKQVNSHDSRIAVLESSLNKIERKLDV